MQSGVHNEPEANNTDSLKPSAENPARNLYSSLLNRSSGRDLLGKKGGKSIKDFTQDWINQYLSGQPRTERSNWLSDDSGSEAPSLLTAHNQFGDDDWLGLEGEPQEDLLKTPKLADFIGRKRLAGQDERSAAVNNSESHHQRADTLRQEDFWGFAYDKDPQPINMLETKDVPPPNDFEEKKAGSPVDKPLPPPPSDAPNEPPSEASSIQPPEASASPKPTEKPSRESSVPITPRPRKRIAWRGKNCIIALPLEDKRGTEESGYRLLSAEEVEQRLREWDEKGYDTRGFSISTEEDPMATLTFGSLSRPTFPDPADTQQEWKTGSYGVSFPNKGEWDAYVNFLQEEKLRALGVDLGGGDEPQPSVSPASASMSQMGPFPGLVSSPPIPTASAASNPLAIPHPFSPHLNQSANMASPASQIGVQSPLLGVDQNVLSRFPIQFQPTPPVQGTLTPQSLLHAQQNDVTSNITSNVANMPSVLSPVSPFNEQGPFQHGLNDGPTLPKGSIDNQLGHDMQDELRPITPVDSQHPDNFHASAVEIAHPTPRGHNHNVSETLQRGLDDFGQPEYHLERSIERQFDEHEPNKSNFNNSDLFKSRWAIPEDAHPTQQRGSLSQQGGLPFGDNDHEGSDFDTNPSLAGTPHLANRDSWNPNASGHQSKLSGSSFNAAANEFDPLGSFSSQNPPFQGNAFQLPGFNQPAYSFGSGPDFKSSFPPSSFDVNAPSFAPGGGSTQKNASQSEFKFSSASFNVDAPVFNPSSSINSAGSTQESNGRTKIFGDLNLSEISRPAKKSKAIPIVRPDEKEQNEDNSHEGAEGAETVDRSKRARHGDERSDKDADITMSSRPLTESHNVQASQGSNTLHIPADGKENAAPDTEGDELADAKTAAPADEQPAERNGTPDSEASTWAAPSEAKGEGEVAAPVPESGQGEEAQKEPEVASTKQPEVESEPKPEPEKLPVQEEAGLFESKEKEPERPAKSTPDPARKRSIFQAIARPFRFKPSVAEFVPSTVEQSKPVETEQPASTPEPAKGQNDLMASRYAPKEPHTTSEPAEPEIEMKEPTPEGDAPQSEHVPGHGGESPNEEELNAIMEQLNEDSDVGIERQETPHPANQTADSTREMRAGPRLVPTKTRSNAPSPSMRGVPGSDMLEELKAGTDLNTRSQILLSAQKDFASGIHSPVRQLTNENEQHISDWDDVIFSGEEEKLVNRSRFFDRRINDLIGSAIEERFSPLERALNVIQDSVASIASAPPRKGALRSASAEVEDSDADDEDEDEENASYRTRSPVNQRDRKFDKLKGVLLEALASREPQQAEGPAITEITRLRQEFAELQALTMQNLSHDPLPNMRATMQEIIATQLSKRSSDADEIGADSLMLQIDGLKNMLRIADQRAEGEYRQRREAQDSMAELQRLLKVAENEAARHSEAAESAEARLLHFKAEKFPYFEKVQFQSDTLTEEHKTLKLTLAELSSKNITLEGTLDEYRESSDHYKREFEGTRTENKKLRDTIDHLKMRVEDGISIRQNLTEKFGRLQDDMTTVQHDVARDREAWRKREEGQNAKYNELRAAYGREVKLREKLEYDISGLEQQEREAAKLKFVFGQSQQENARLEELAASLRAENRELEAKAARFEREFNEARESSRGEIQRTRTSLESDIDAANNQVNIVRAELEAQIIRLQGQQDNIKLDADTARERYELLLEEANESKANALAAAAESKETAVEEQRKMHERVLNDLRERHARALHNSSDAKQRIESHLTDRLSLSDEKVHHLQDRINHLEEKLEIAKSAARAAAEAAQAKGASPPPLQSTAPSMAYSRGSELPDKISPQALRESILVLQDQLQQREAHIEELEQEVSSIDKEAPNKLKEKDTEINWLRELLGVRTDDLQDIINTVSQPSFDHNTVRDAAIRLRANLQMQLQERERAVSGQSFPSLRSISELTASPRAFPMAAAAALGNWRKGREHANPAASEQTPSKPSNAGAFLSGLLTPPGSNARQPPNTGAPAPASLRRSSETRPLRSRSSTPRPLAERGPAIPDPPKTPPLLRKSNYDHDAEPANYEHDDFGDDVESTADGLVTASPKETEEPFGPQISAAATD